MARTVNTGTDERSSVLPSDPFEMALSRLLGHPNGAHTQPTVVQAIDWYGNTARYIVQTVKWEEGLSVFITQVMAGDEAQCMVLPPAVTKLLQRQADAVTAINRRRQGKRLAAQRQANGHTPTFTPEMRAKAAATRRANAARRAARRAKRR